MDKSFQRPNWKAAEISRSNCFTLQWAEYIIQSSPSKAWAAPKSNWYPFLTKSKKKTRSNDFLCLCMLDQNPIPWMISLKKKVPDQAIHYSPPFPSNPKEKAVGFQIHSSGLHRLTNSTTNRGRFLKILVNYYILTWFAA